MDEKTKNGLIIAAFVVLSFVCLVNHLTIAELENDVHVLDVLNTKQGTRMENLEEFVGMESPSMFETDVWDVEFEGDGFTMTRADRVIDDILVSEGAKYVIIEDEDMECMYVIKKVDGGWGETPYYFMSDDGDEMNVVFKK